MKERSERIPWHALSAPEVLKRLDVTENGLTSDQARQRLKTFGPNVFATSEGINPFRLLLSQFRDPLVYLLIGAAALSAFTGSYVDAGVIVAVVLLNAVLGFSQEWRAEGALAALQKMSAPQARVYRSGELVRIDAAEVVPGDILILETGDRVAADARVLTSEDLYSDESALTGESEAVRKVPGELPEETPLADRKNMVWMSTSITAGRGRAVVVSTGSDTQIGAIAEEVRTTEREESPLQKRMSQLGATLGIAGVAMAALVFVLGLFRGYEAVDMALFAVAVAVAFIPEGLPAVISVVLALGVQRMARRNAIIRRLPAVETLGSTTIICTDKTGTLTENQMTVRNIWADGRLYDVTGTGYAPHGEVTYNGEVVQRPTGALARLLEIGVLANNSAITPAESGWQVEGDPGEGALLTVAHKAGFEPSELAEIVPRIGEIPFSSERKYMATLNRGQGDRPNMLYVKGAPERLLDFCTHIELDGQRVRLTPEHRAEIQAVIENLASKALRVLAGAYKEMDPQQYEVKPIDVENGLTFVGLWAMIDPPRPESARAVADAIAAGIRPIMMTGDQAATAIAIAKDVGITQSDRALGSQDVNTLDSDTLAEKAIEYGVFARLSPSEKLTVMRALKTKGHIVAMTGDGVNDAPSLKGADIGIAMGQTGTEVAKESADMILTDDNFATIIHAVEEGRGIYNNLRRVTFFLLGTNSGEILTLVGALLLGLELPLSAVMILWINLVTDGLCTIPLGLEPRHRAVLRQPPRDPQEPILDAITLRRMAILTPLMAIGTLGLFAYELSIGTLEHARTVAFSTLAAFQWFQALNARSQQQSIFTLGFFTNRPLLAGIFAAVVLQLIAVQTGLGNWLFGTVPLSLTHWLWIILVSSSVWIVDELLKAIGFHRPRQRRTVQSQATQS